MTDLFGQDIRLDEGLEAVVAANGELVLTQGPETGCQDVRLRLFTRLGTLFYDQDFGALIHDWIREENTLFNRLALEAEIARRIGRDPRVVVGSAEARVAAWNENGVTVRASWRFIEEDHPYNLVIDMTDAKISIVVADVNPRE
ncbi:MAG: baseplate assembly protein [Deltaproteobacteria bacterium HGW-Deltaproteobacteria-21]|nr:MAG: baseplate assembly protein [Deltaproteobacteria bacterium HGW-Deltaproteobacteria-21]